MQFLWNICIFPAHVTFISATWQRSCFVSSLSLIIPQIHNNSIWHNSITLTYNDIVVLWYNIQWYRALWCNTQWHHDVITLHTMISWYYNIRYAVTTYNTVMIYNDVIAYNDKRVYNAIITSHAADVWQHFDSKIWNIFSFLSWENRCYYWHYSSLFRCMPLSVSWYFFVCLAVLPCLFRYISMYFLCLFQCISLSPND